MVGLTFTGKVKAQTVASNNLDERIKKVESNLMLNDHIVRYKLSECFWKVYTLGS